PPRQARRGVHHVGGRAARDHDRRVVGDRAVELGVARPEGEARRHAGAVLLDDRPREPDVLPARLDLAAVLGADLAGAGVPDEHHDVVQDLEGGLVDPADLVFRQERRGCPDHGWLPLARRTRPTLAPQGTRWGSGFAFGTIRADGDGRSQMSRRKVGPRSRPGGASPSRRPPAYPSLAADADEQLTGRLVAVWADELAELPLDVCPRPLELCRGELSRELSKRQRRLPRVLDRGRQRGEPTFRRHAVNDGAV